MSARAIAADLDTSNWTRENLAWAAGFIDGEGSIHLTADGYCVNLSVGQKDPELLYRLKDVIGGGVVYEYDDCTRNVWKLVRKMECYAVLVALYQWLSSRRQEKIREVVSELFPVEVTI